MVRTMSPMFWERSLMYKCMYNIRISDIMVCFSENKTVCPDYTNKFHNGMINTGWGSGCDQARPPANTIKYQPPVFSHSLNWSGK